MKTLRTVGLVAVVFAVATLTGCSAPNGDHPPAGSAFEALRLHSPERPVATVNDTALGLGEFQAYWDAHREASAGEVVDAVVDREIAVQKALEAEDHRDRRLGFVRKAAMVRGLLRNTVEKAVTEEDLDPKEIQRLERNLRNRLGRPRGIRASHLLVMLPGKKNNKKGAKERSDAMLKRAESWAHRIRDSLPAEPTTEDLFAARRAFEGRLEKPLDAVVNANLSFPAPDARPFRGELPTGWMRVVKAFRDAAHRMLEEGRAGQLSKPVKSKYGWHLILPERRLEGRVPQPEALHEVAVSKALRKRRNAELMKRFKKWQQGMTVATYPEAIPDEE
mgnify:CR=1 FL=1